MTANARRRDAAALLAVVLAAGAGHAVWRAFADHGVGERVAATAAAGDIVMYSSQSCAVCARARAWFAAHRVPYDECVIERDAACDARFRALASPGTPTLTVRGRRLIGFDPKAVADALAEAPPGGG